MSAETETSRVNCQTSQRSSETPCAGGVIPRPRLLITYGEASSSATATRTPYQERAISLRQSHTPAMVRRSPASARTPADADKGPNNGRKKVAREKSG